MFIFKDIPFLRICLPFVAGILVAVPLGLNAVALPLFFVLVLIGVILTWLKSSSLNKLLFFLCADAFLFCFAINLSYSCNIVKNKAFYGLYAKKDSTNKMIVVIKDLPVQKQKFVKCELKVLKVKTKTGYKNTKGDLIGYFKNAQLTNQLQAGNVLLINSKLLEIESPKNPYEFDYKSYMAHRQVYYTTFIDSGAFAITPHAAPLSSLWLIGLKIKKHLLWNLKNSELDKNAYGICAALLTGYDDDIDTSVMEAFSHSGTLHVLSVSGLHTGLIYLVLSFLFDLIDRKKKYKIIKFVFITGCLWLFALVTGFSAPVLRAVIMFNLLGFGKIFFRSDYRNQINILLVSAFMLLCYNPFLIYNIGFLLSYFALFGILFFQPIFAKLWQPHTKITLLIWQSVTASFAATLSTLPFTLFYFKQFPLWFFICNLIVVPATFVILLMAILVVLKVTPVCKIINFIIIFLTSFINLFNREGAGYIDNIHFTAIDAILLSLLLIIITVGFYFRSYKYIIYSAIVLLCWQVNGLITSYNAKNKNYLTVYHLKKQNAFSIKNKKEVVINSIGIADFSFHVKPHLISFNNPSINGKAFNHVISRIKHFLIIDKQNLWPVTDYRNISVLVISNNCKVKATDLQQFNNLKTIVADGTNNRYTIKQLAKLCSKFGVEFFSTQSKGAYVCEI
ncbi:MAG: ComEC family competence protein [Bacteroidetes bacterium]|nr:ComEC family competence protein [Bacteroidota bacterium]